MKASINVTPLVDVVLVLLIIFMVMAPQMRKGPEVAAENGEADSAGCERGRILVSIDEAGGGLDNDKQVAMDQFGNALRTAMAAETDPRVVIRGDQSLTSARSGKPCRRSSKPASGE